MNRQSTLKTFVWNLVWILIFLGSISAVTVIRRTLRDNEQFANAARTIATEAIHLTGRTRSLLVP
jgi:hypothetical protein